MRTVVLIASALVAFGLIVGACKSSSTPQVPTSNLYADTPTVGGVPTSVGTTPTEGASVGSFADKCQKSDQKQFTQPEQIIDTSKTYVATIKTAKGDIVLELDNRHAVTTNNFVFLACKGFYDGVTFHRVEAGFVIQGGAPQANGQGGPGYSIPGEFDGSNFVKGVIGMARVAGDPDSADSQFYIMIGDAHSLDGQYADFGHVTSGQDVADQIAVGDVIETITIEEQ